MYFLSLCSFFFNNMGKRGYWEVDDGRSQASDNVNKNKSDNGNNNKRSKNNNDRDKGVTDNPSSDLQPTNNPVTPSESRVLIPPQQRVITDYKKAYYTLDPENAITGSSLESGSGRTLKFRVKPQPRFFKDVKLRVKVTADATGHTLTPTWTWFSKIEIKCNGGSSVTHRIHPELMLLREAVARNKQKSEESGELFNHTGDFKTPVAQAANEVRYYRCHIPSFWEYLPHGYWLNNLANDIEIIFYFQDAGVHASGSAGGTSTVSDAILECFHEHLSDYDMERAKKASMAGCKEVPLEIIVPEIIYQNVTGTWTNGTQYDTRLENFNGLLLNCILFLWRTNDNPQNLLAPKALVASATLNDARYALVDAAGKVQENDSGDLYPHDMLRYEMGTSWFPSAICDNFDFGILPFGHLGAFVAGGQLKGAMYFNGSEKLRHINANSGISTTPLTIIGFGVSTILIDYEGKFAKSGTSS